MSRHTATDSSEDERSEFELGGRRELRVLDNEIFLVAMRLGVTPVLIPNTKVKAWAADGTALETVWQSRWLLDLWGYSSVGRAPALQAGGQEFESPRLHHLVFDSESVIY